MQAHPPGRNRSPSAAPRRRLLLLFVLLTFAAAGAGAQEKKDDDSPILNLFNEQLLLIATVVGAVASLPALIEFLIERRKRRERLALSIDDVPVEELRPRVAGLDDLLEGMADLLDRARNPDPYAQLSVGNEVLLIGPPLSGKKSLAQRMALEAGLERLITVYNPRNKDALAKAKSLVHAYGRRKLMLLLPHIDSVFAQGDEDVLAELDVLIDGLAGRDNVLVVGTALGLQPDGPLDNLFGIKIVLPGAGRCDICARHLPDDARRVLSEVIRFYLQEARQAGFVLQEMTEREFHERLLEIAGNAAEVEDILGLCRTTAIHERERGRNQGLILTRPILEKAIVRVIVNVVDAEGHLHGTGSLSARPAGGATPAGR